MLNCQCLKLFKSRQLAQPALVIVKGLQSILVPQLLGNRSMPVIPKSCLKEVAESCESILDKITTRHPGEG